MGIKPGAWIEWFRASTASRLKAMTAANVEPEPIIHHRASPFLSAVL
jgi:hypothetical protein